MVDDLLPPDFNKKGKKKKRREEQGSEIPSDSPLADIPSDDTSPEDLPDLGGGDFDDFFEPKSKPKKKSSKESTDKTDAAAADEWAEAPDDDLPKDDLKASDTSGETSEWEFGGPDEKEISDQGASEWDLGGSGAEESKDADAFSFDESETSTSGSKDQETYDFGEPEWETPEGSVDQVSEVVPSKPEDEWAEAPEFTSAFADNIEQPESAGPSDFDQQDLGSARAESDSGSSLISEEDNEPNLANADVVSPDDEPMKTALDNVKPPFLQSKQGRLAMMAGGCLLALLLVLIPIVLFLAPSSDKQAEETTTTMGSEGSTSTTVPLVPGGSGANETTTTTLLVPVIIEEATPDVTTPANIEFKDPFEPLPVGSTDGRAATTDTVTDPNAKVMILTRISIEEGTEYSYVTYDGAGYKVQESERVGVSPYQVKSIGADYTLFLFGDDQIALRVGESIIK